MSLARQEQKALARWRPPADALFNRFLTLIVVSLSRLIMKRVNSLTIEGEVRFEALLSRGGRGLLTRLVFGEAIDCEALVSEIRAREDGPPASGPRLWDSLTERSYEALREMEIALHPDASVEREVKEAPA